MGINRGTMRHALGVCATLALLLVTPASCACAGVLLVPLPGVTGTYDSGGPERRTVTFQLPGSPAVVRGVSLRVVGSSVVGQLDCSSTQDPIHPWPAYLAGWIGDAPDYGWNAVPETPVITGPFDLTVPFFDSSSPWGPASTWSFLADGRGDLVFIGGPGMNALGCTEISPAPTVTVDQAWLLVDADIAVPAHGASWGRVKAIYR